MDIDTVKPQRVRYIECDKGGMHYGEVLNMVCLEPSYI